jgi:hypothetical protein
MTITYIQQAVIDRASYLAELSCVNGDDPAFESFYRPVVQAVRRRDVATILAAYKQALVQSPKVSTLAWRSWASSYVEWAEAQLAREVQSQGDRAVA